MAKDIKARSLGLDIFRILAMCGIIGLHVMGNGGVLKNANIFNIDYPILLTLYIFFYLSVNSFALLSGYLAINKKTNKHSRIIELLLVIAFFIVAETTVFYLFDIKGIQATDKKELVKSLFPFGVGYYWYITCYAFLFFLIPYINKLANSLSKAVYRKLIITIVVLLSIIPNIFLQTDFFRIDNGYTAMWLIACYLIGGYIRLYPPKLSNKQLVFRFSISIVIMIAFNYAWRILSNKAFGHSVRDSWMINYISPLNLYASTTALLLFSRMNLTTRYQKAIIALSASSFSVYILHDHYLFFNYVLKDGFSSINEYNVFMQLACILGGIVAIYTFGFFIDLLRKIIFKMFHINKLSEKIGLQLDSKLEIKDEN